MRLKKSDVNEEEVRNDLKDLLYKVPSMYYVSTFRWVVGFRGLSFFNRFCKEMTGEWLSMVGHSALSRGFKRTYQRNGQHCVVKIVTK